MLSVPTSDRRLINCHVSVRSATLPHTICRLALHRSPDSTSIPPAAAAPCPLSPVRTLFDSCVLAMAHVGRALDSHSCVSQLSRCESNQIDARIVYHVRPFSLLSRPPPSASTRLQHARPISPCVRQTCSPRRVSSSSQGHICGLLLVVCALADRVKNGLCMAGRGLCARCVRART